MPSKFPKNIFELKRKAVFTDFEEGAKNSRF